MFVLLSPRVSARRGPVARLFSSAAEAPVLYKQSGSAHVVTLNRPKALNALNLDMVRSLHEAVPAWLKEDAAAVVVMKGAGGKAFCAGGDVKSLWELKGKPGAHEVQETFFREEYIVDHMLAKSTEQKPLVALWDGTVMGGGVGISINASFRVATEKALFAMPETGIGLFPDVGGSYFLPRLPQKFGIFLALTGHRLTGAELVHAGIATHFVHSSRLPELEKALTEVKVGHKKLSLHDQGHHHKKHSDQHHNKHSSSGSGSSVPRHIPSPHEQVQELLKGLSSPLPPSSFHTQDRDFLETAMGQKSIERILQYLQVQGAEGSNQRLAGLASKSLSALSKMSPTSLKITLEQMKRGAEMSLADCYAMELRMTAGCMKGHDFYEGIRAVLVDRDGKPQWRPSKLEEVTEAEVASYFAHLPSNRELRLH